MTKIIKYLYLLTLLVWPFGLLLSFQSAIFPVYVLDILVVTLSALYLLDNLKSLRKDKVFNHFLAFTLIVVFSMLLNISRIGVLSLAYTLRLFSYPVIFFVASNHKKETAEVLPVIFMIFLFFGLLQYFFFPDMRYLRNLGFDDHFYRLIGTLYDPNFSGAIIGSLCLYFLVKSRYYLGLISLLVLALTFSRASYLAFFVGIFSYILWTKKYKLATFLVCLAVLVLLIPKPFGEGVNLLRTFSVFSRIDNWQTNLLLFVQKPLFGFGYGTLRVVDSSPIMVLVSTGVFGLFTFFSFLRQIFFRLDPLEKSFAVTIITHSLFNNSFFFIWIYLLFFVVLGSNTREYKSP
jgi:hypothetical protein